MSLLYIQQLCVTHESKQ